MKSGFLGTKCSNNYTEVSIIRGVIGILIIQFLAVWNVLNIQHYLLSITFTKELKQTYPQLRNLSNFVNQFSFPLVVRKIRIPLYIFLKTFCKWLTVNPKQERSRLKTSPNTEKKIENTNAAEYFWRHLRWLKMFQKLSSQSKLKLRT